MDRKVELISKVPLFSHCSKKELQQIAQAADEIDLPAGKILTYWSTSPPPPPWPWNGSGR